MKCDSWLERGTLLFPSKSPSNAIKSIIYVPIKKQLWRWWGAQNWLCNDKGRPIRLPGRLPSRPDISHPATGGCSALSSTLQLYDATILVCHWRTLNQVDGRWCCCVYLFKRKLDSKCWSALLDAPVTRQRDGAWHDPVNHISFVWISVIGIVQCFFAIIL